MTCFALGRNCIAVDKDSVCVGLAKVRLVKFMKANPHAARGGAIAQRAALESTCMQTIVRDRRDEQPSPFGWHNRPTLHIGRSERALSRDEDCTRQDVYVAPSGLSRTVDGPCGLGLFTKVDREPGDMIATYWGDFLTKDSQRHLFLKANDSKRMLTMRAFTMHNYVLLGHRSCAATFVQSSDYKEQTDIVANCEIFEAPVESVTLAHPDRYVYIRALCDIEAKDQLFASYNFDPIEEKNHRGRKRRHNELECPTPPAESVSLLKYFTFCIC